MKKFLPLSTVFFCLTVAHIPTIAQGTWTQKASLPAAGRVGAVGFSIGLKGYVGTGGGTSAFQDFWEWDGDTASPTYNTWTQKANFGGGNRWLAVGFSIGTKGYISTGALNVNTFYSDLWEWDQATNTWAQKASFGNNYKRGEAIGFSIGNKGYIGAGDDGFILYFDFWEWNQATNTWTKKASIDSVGGGRTYAVGFSIGNKGYIGTGTGSGNYNDFWEYDTTSDTWTQKANVPVTPRFTCTGFSVKAKGYIGIGADGSGAYKDFLEWDQATNTWAQKANYPGMATRSATGFSIGNKGYMGMGGDIGFTIGYNDFWEYTPDTVTGINNIQENVFIKNIFPNPFSSQTVLQSDNFFHNATLTVYNCFGQQVKEIKNISGQSVTFHRDNLASGIYFYKVTGDKGQGAGEVLGTGKLVITDN
ncbi:MAG: T9SS type A sorting domain-containing protein [Bacteroidetes bacterium]|nr:T9SS type A sorting domain-containing protein [Bacteroidota bacterium]